MCVPVCVCVYIHVMCMPACDVYAILYDVCVPVRAISISLKCPSCPQMNCRLKTRYHRWSNLIYLINIVGLIKRSVFHLIDKISAHRKTCPSRHCVINWYAAIEPLLVLPHKSLAAVGTHIFVHIASRETLHAAVISVAAAAEADKCSSHSITDSVGLLVSNYPPSIDWPLPGMTSDTPTFADNQMRHCFCDPTEPNELLSRLGRARFEMRHTRESVDGSLVFILKLSPRWFMIT